MGTNGLSFGNGDAWRTRAVDRMRSEGGIALPAALILLLVITVMSGALAASAISGNNESKRDRGTKRAVAAADAGIDAAVYRLNKLKPDALPCVVVGATGLQLESVQADGWCRAQTEDLGDGATYSYRMSGAQQLILNGQQLLQRKILSTGTAGAVNRRVLATVGSATGKPLFSGNAITSLTDLTLPNSTLIQGNAASNGNIALRESSQLCGDASVGPNKQFTTANSAFQCAGYGSVVATEPLLLNPVDQGNAPTVNDNERIGVLDPFLSSSSSTWSPASRFLKLKQSSVLTLTGNVYSFCDLEIANQAQLVIGARAPTAPPLKIYIDAPENCPGVAGAGSVKLTEQSGILNLNSSPATLQLYVVGSTQTPTSVAFSNSFQSDVNLLVYAPRSTVTLQNSTSLVGAVAANTVSLQNSAEVRWNPAANITVDNLVPLFRRQSWVECSTSQTTSAPDSGC